MADEQGELNNNNNADNDRMNRPDSCENLDLSFDDLYIEDLMDGNNNNDNNSSSNTGTNNSDPTNVQKPSKLSSTTSEEEEQEEYYILGTLIVRVVAARDLQSAGPVGGGGGIGKLLFGNHHHNNGPHRNSSSREYYSGSNHHHNYNNNNNSTNPYASVRFGRTTQRTSQVYGTVDPIWPRGECMYMDVVHPRSFVGRRNDNNNNNDHNNNNNNTAIMSCHETSKKSTASMRASSDFLVKKPPSNSSSSSSSSRHYSKPILTVAIFHANNNNNNNNHYFQKYPTKKGGADYENNGDSDDQFLGMTAVDLTWLFTGKLQHNCLDEWLPLSGSSSNRAMVRIVCEYEPSDTAPCPGDWVRFTQFCHPADLYPFYQYDRLYRVEEEEEHENDNGNNININNNNGCRHGNHDNVLISYTSPEGWVSTVLVHRYMLICEERLERAAGGGSGGGGMVELASLQHKIAHSPMIHVVQDTMQRLPDEGLIGVGVDVVRGGASLLTRWMEGGVGTAMNDIVFATNWDGRFNPDAATTLSTMSFDENEQDNNGGLQQQQQQSQNAIYSGTNNVLAAAAVVDDDDGLATEDFYPDIEPLPNMPNCPITGEPMRNPVVAADGHTYERSAIARWLKTSDKSPLTGSILPHKNLVPNYMLLSSLSEAATAIAATSAASISTTATAVAAAAAKPPPPSSLQEECDDDDDVTAEVKIDD